MHNIFTQNRSTHSQIAKALSMKAQILISDFLDYGLIEEAKEIQQIDEQLIWLLMQYKMTGVGTHYIWHTEGDDKVRASHAANNGKIFAWNNPPETGHPGEDYNCRCWAEPIRIKEYVRQTLFSITEDSSDRWDDWDFIYHAYFGNGIPVTLSGIGHLSEVIYHAEYGTDLYKNVNEQIIAKAIAQGEGSLDNHTSNSYNFRPVQYSHGASTVDSYFNGNVAKGKGYLEIRGFIRYKFEDYFTDPVRIRDRLLGMTSDPKSVPDWVRLTTDLFGIVYKISDFWQTEFTAIIRQDEK